MMRLRNKVALALVAAWIILGVIPAVAQGVKWSWRLEASVVRGGLAVMPYLNTDVVQGYRYKDSMMRWKTGSWNNRAKEWLAGYMRTAHLFTVVMAGATMVVLVVNEFKGAGERYAY